MKKQVIAILLTAGLFVTQAQGQQFEQDPNVIQGKAAMGKRVFKTENPAADKTENFDVKSIGVVSFAASNTADGSANSYKHALRITMSLVMADPKAGNYQLVFYSEGEQVPLAVAREAGMVSIYYPASVYTDIKDKLEQALLARKKVTIKVTEKTTGFREGVLSF
ncbi:MAG TPA: hypothetical protein PLB49_00895 [Chitinophagaceae bacterium]|nr:hypothetical protein [Chitinophagaceae bacterium]